MWFPTAYGVQLVSEWPEMRGHRPSRTVSDPTAVRLKAGHTLTVAETALAFLEDARRHGDLFRPLDWIPEVHHPIGSGEAVIPDALLYYRRGPQAATTGRCCGRSWKSTGPPWAPNASPPSCPRTSASTATCPRSRAPADPPGADAGGVAAALSALPARPVRPGRHRTRRCREPDQRPALGSRLLMPSGFLHDVPVLVAPLADLLQHGPSAPVWRPVHDPDQRVHWTGSARPQT
nr:replication-relaxation family protein [Streptomyces avermitilis]